MNNDERAVPSGRAKRQSEIFLDPPGSGNYSSSIGKALPLFVRQVGKELPLAEAALIPRDVLEALISEGTQ